MVKKLFLFYCALLLCSGFLRAESSAYSEGNISFKVPPEFTPLSEEMKKGQYRKGKVPRYLIGNKSGSVSITYGIIPLDNNNLMLKELTEFIIKDARSNFPDATYLKNGIESINGYQCLYLDMLVGPRGGETRFTRLFTIYGNKILMLQITCRKKEDYQAHKAPIKALIKSLRVKKDAESSVDKSGTLPGRKKKQVTENKARK